MSDWPDEAILATAVDAARKEQAIGYDGWVQTPPECAAAVRRLIKRQLLRRGADGFVMPTPAGFAMIEREGHA